MNNWISAKEELPPNYEEVLVYGHRGGQKIFGIGWVMPEGYNSKKLRWSCTQYWSDGNGMEVTHWMPLPTPPCRH